MKRDLLASRFPGSAEMTILYEERALTTGIFRGVAHAQLSREEFLLTIADLPFFVQRTSIASISRVVWFKSLLTTTISIHYLDSEGRFYSIEFAPRHLQNWIIAFSYLTISVHQDEWSQQRQTKRKQNKRKS